MTERAKKLIAGGRIRRSAVLMACAVLAALALPTAAPAARGLVTGFQADEYVSSDPAERALWMDRTEAVGAGLARLPVVWSGVATGAQKPLDPTNPGSVSYDFSQFDRAVRDLEARGLTVLLAVGPGTPPWAEGTGRPDSIPAGRWKPTNPSDVADFIQAVAARYSGNFDPDGAGPAAPLPAAQALEVWNEENGEPWMSPQYGGSVEYYRMMLNDSYRAVKAVNPKMLVVTGGTMPYGDPPAGPYPASGGRIRPVTFWEQLLCVHPAKGANKRKKGKKRGAGYPSGLVRTRNCSAPAMFDVFAHHALDNTGGGPHQSGPSRDDASTPDLGRVVRVLRAAEKAGTVLSGKHPVWVTEFWWDSNPPNRSGAPLPVQARWIEESLYLFWRAGASVAVNFMIRDTTFRPNVRAGYQAGLFFNDGRPKPAYTAFSFPFVAERINKGSMRAWGKSPVAGKLVIQRKDRGRWRRVKKLRVGEGSVFLTKLKLRGTQRLRATVAGKRSLVWKEGGAGKKTSAGGGRSAAATISLIALLALVVTMALLRARHVRRLRHRRRGPRRRAGVRRVAG